MKKGFDEKDFTRRVNACFKANDIRCLYGKELNDEIAYRVGKAVVSHFKCKEIFVGKDMRYSSDALEDAFMRGVRDQGANAIYLGMVDTPAIYFASGKYKKHGAMITASHNPLEFNGIKLVKPGAQPIGRDSGLEKIKKIILKDKYSDQKKKGKLIKKNIFKEYKKHILSIVDKEKLRPLKVVVDTGHGVGGKIVPIIYKGLPIKIIPLDFKINPKNPLHQANPAVYKNLKDLQKAVKKKKADFGMAFDSDMDRVFFVDEKGEILSSSIAASIIIKNYIGKHPRRSVIYSLICSKIVPETIKQYKGKAIRGKVGHSYIKAEMKKTRSHFAVERSGHYYYSNNFYADSGIITSLIMYEIISKNDLPLSALASEFRKYAKLEEKSLKALNAMEVAKKVEASFVKRKPKKHDHFDGITVEFDDFWFNIRPSHTEALVRVNLEAKTKKMMREEYKNLLALIKGCAVCKVDSRFLKEVKKKKK